MPTPTTNAPPVCPMCGRPTRSPSVPDGDWSNVWEELEASYVAEELERKRKNHASENEERRERISQSCGRYPIRINSDEENNESVRGCSGNG